MSYSASLGVAHAALVLLAAPLLALAWVVALMVGVLDAIGRDRMDRQPLNEHKREALAEWYELEARELRDRGDVDGWHLAQEYEYRAAALRGVL